jgi:autotransporter-associated beta strand protein
MRVRFSPPVSLATYPIAVPQLLDVHVPSKRRNLKALAALPWSAAPGQATTFFTFSRAPYPPRRTFFMNHPLTVFRHTATFVLAISLLFGSARATTTVYPDPFTEERNWDATSGIASGNTVELQRRATYSSSVSPIINSGTLLFNVSDSTVNDPYVFSLAMSGTGTVTLADSVVSLTGTNSYIGGTTVGAGSALFGTTASLTGAINNQGTLRFQQDSNGTYAGAISGGGRIQRYGTGTVTLTGTNATAFEIYNDAFGGRLVGNTDSLKGTISNGGGTLEFNQTSDGTFAGNFGTFDTGAVYKTGTAALTLSGNNRLQAAGQSDLFIDAGRVQGPAASLDFNGTITIATGAELRIIEPTGAFVSFIQSEITGAGGVYKMGTGTVDLTQATNTYAGATEVADGKLLFRYGSLPRPPSTSNYSPMQLTGSGTINTVGISIDTGGGPASDQEYSATISGPGSLTVTGGSYLNLTGTNTYTGGSFVGDTARLVGTAQTIPGAVSLLGVGSGVEYRQVTDATVSALISGTGDIYKTGVGSLTLTTNSSLAGTIVVEAGTLVANNQMPNISRTRVRNGATLAGSGTIGSNQQFFVGIEIEDGTLTPGNSAGIITTNDLDMAGTLTGIEWELTANTAAAGSRGTLFDGINLTNGNLTIDSGAELDLVFNAAGSSVNWFNGLWDANQSWVLIDGVVNFTGNASDVFSTYTTSLDAVGGNLATLRPGAGFTAAFSSGDIFINYTSAVLVPEPSALALAAIAALGGLAAVARRR